LLTEHAGHELRKYVGDLFDEKRCWFGVKENVYPGSDGARRW